MVRPYLGLVLYLLPVLTTHAQNVYPNTRIVMVPAEYLQQYQEQAKGRQALGPVQFGSAQGQRGQQHPRYISVPPIPAAPTPVYDTQYQHVVAQQAPVFPPTQRVTQLLLPGNADRQVQKAAEQIGGQDLSQQIQVVQQQSLANQALTAAQRRNMAELRRAQQQNVAFQAQVREAQQNHKQLYLQYDVAPNHSGIPAPPPVPRPPQYRGQPQPNSKVQFDYQPTQNSVTTASSTYQAQLKAAQPQRYVYDVGSGEDVAQSQHEAAQQEQYLVEVRPQQQPRYQPQQITQQEYEHTRPQYVTQQYESGEVKQSPRLHYRPQVAQSQEQEQEQEDSQEEHDTKSSYQFGFDVKDDHNTNYQNRKETRENGKITGSYSVVDSDGYIRTVTYTADPKEGFKAEVVRKPTDIVVKIPERKVKQQEVQQEYYREVPVHLAQNVKQNVIYRYQ